MQFGIGILGKGWNSEGAIRLALDDARPASSRFPAHAAKYAAKLAADTILSEPSSDPDLTDAGLVRHFALCARPVRWSEAHMVRDAFLATYGGGA